MQFTEIELMFLKCVGYEVDLQNGTVTICGVTCNDEVRGFVDKQHRTIPYFKSGDNSISILEDDSNNDELNTTTISKDGNTLYLISPTFFSWIISISTYQKEGQPETTIIRAVDNKNGKALNGGSCSHITETFVMDSNFDHFLSIDVSSSGDGINRSHNISCSPLGISYKHGTINSQPDDLSSTEFVRHLHMATFQRGSNTLISNLFADKFKPIYELIYSEMIEKMKECADTLLTELEKKEEALNTWYDSLTCVTALNQAIYTGQMKRIANAHILLEGLDLKETLI